MKTAWRIFLRDLKRIARNPVAIIITFGVCVIPSLYAWINILANWDPYNNTSTVPIAVTIKDEGADIPGVGFTNAGDLIHDQLEQNTQLGWSFVDDEGAAREGVTAGRYYAAFVVPTDFTSSLADVLDGNTDKAHIAYYVNEKVNAISPKVADTGASTLEQQITQQFVNVVSTTIAQKLQTGVTDASAKIEDANASVVRELRDSQSTLSGLSTGLGDGQATISSARDAISQAHETLSDLSGTSDSLADTLEDALGTLGDTRTKSQTLASKLSSALGTGITSISGISSDANYDIGQITGDIGWAQGKIDAAISQILALNGTVQTLKGTLEDTRTTIVGLTLPDGTSTEIRNQISTELDGEINVLVELSDKQLEDLKRLQEISDAIKDGSDSVAGLSDAVNSAIQSSTKGLSDLQSDLQTKTMPSLSSSLDSFSSAGGKLAGTVGALGPMLDQADKTLTQLDDILAQSSQTLTQTADSLGKAAGQVGSLADDVAGLQSISSYDLVKRILGLDPEKTGEYLGSPVEMVSESVFPMANYGSGMTPFYTNLGLWVGGFVLVAIYKLEVDREGIGTFKPWQGFFGRWLLMVLLGLVQGLICTLGDLVLGIQCLYPAAFVLAGCVCSFVYVTFIYAISVAFKHIGKAIGVLLVILQIPGASGTYPIELQPGFFQALHPWLPFTYGINAMREAIAGFYENYYVENLLVLLVFLIPAFLIGVTARRHLLNINSLFDRKLAETGMMYTERVGMKGSYFRLSTLVKVIMDSEQYKETFLKRVAQFELMYPVLVKRGFQALVGIPLLLLILLFVLPAKFLLLMLWILSCVLVCTYLIVVEYFHSRVGQKTALANLSREELYGLLDDELRGELMAFAPIQKMRLDRAVREAGPDRTARMPEQAAAPEGSEDEAPEPRAAETHEAAEDETPRDAGDDAVKPHEEPKPGRHMRDASGEATNASAHDEPTKGGEA